MFVKLFQQILDSSIADDRRLRHFFTDLLLCADSTGLVMMTHGAIARRIGADLEEVEWGLNALMQPDPLSKTPDAEGRRIEALEGTGYGWRILNYEHYRAMKDAEQLRETTRERVRRFRAKKAAEIVGNADVTPCNAMQKEKKKQKQKKKEEPEPRFSLEADAFEAAMIAKEKKQPATSNADPRFISFRDTFIEAYESFTSQKYRFRPHDGVQLASLLKDSATVTAIEFRGALDWCRKVASRDRYAKGCVKNTSNLAAFCTAWNDIAEYFQTYTDPVK